MNGEAAPAGRRERRRMRVRLLLLKVTRELMHAKGLDGLTIADITEAADVARGSFYVHFASKDEVVEAVVLAGLRTLAEEVALDLTSDEDPAVRASDAARHVIRLTQDDPDLGSLLLQFNNAESLFTEAMTPFGRLLIERGQLSGRFAVSDLDVAVVSATAGAFAVIRAILRGELPPGSDRAHAEGVLRSLGVPFEEAHTISVRPLRRQKRSAKTPEGRLA